MGVQVITGRLDAIKEKPSTPAGWRTFLVPRPELVGGMPPMYQREGKDTELRRTVAELYRLVTERGALQLSMDSYAALYSAVLHL